MSNSPDGGKGRERHRIVVCFGTRPEAIKLCPVVADLRARPNMHVCVCVTGQHREMLDQVLDVFAVTPDRDLNLMSPGQDLARLGSLVTEGVAKVLEEERADLLVVQGDTTTTFASALAAFYERVPVAHVEAGLRTYNPLAPFPEELNRQMTSCLADWHFAPTAGARDALLAERFAPSRVFLVGNTVIDALQAAIERASELDAEMRARFSWARAEGRILLVTGHRRESFGGGLERICAAIAEVAAARPDLTVVYPVHLNPRVGRPVSEALGDLPNVFLTEPLDYLSFVWLMNRSHIILTDSGGIQEEAPALGKPVLVTRDTTERPEAVEAGVARLVGTNRDLIVRSVSELLDDRGAYARMSAGVSPYGDGASARRIGDVLSRVLADPSAAGAGRRGSA